MYIPEQRAEGITKARLVANIDLAKASQPLHVDDAAYVAFVCESVGLNTLLDYASESYCDQHKFKSISELELELIGVQNALDQ